VIWHSLTYNFENYDQLIRRLRRSGQRERVLVAHIIAKDTIDSVLLATLRRKDKTQGNLFSALKDYWVTNANR
jgi:SNF2 family DNA or RNA helicase